VADIAIVPAHSSQVKWGDAYQTDAAARGHRGDASPVARIDRDQNLPLRETLQALDSLPATASGLLTLVRFPEADHGMYRSDGSRVNDWETIASWLRRNPWPAWRSRTVGSSS
jgi:hypothetical protein